MDKILRTTTLRVHVLERALLAVFVCAIFTLLVGAQAGAINQIPDPDPKPGSFGLEATKPQAPPKTGAHITTPGNGASFTSSPIDINGICPKGLLVQVYDNNVMVGAVMCSGGSFHVKVSLFAGKNVLTALVFDDLGQSGPKSNSATVTYTNAHFTAFGKLLTLTSDYGRRSAGVGSQLDWPLKLTGGTGPYALSIDWGDGGTPALQSQGSAGGLTIAHTYKQAGIYIVNVRATDKNGVTAFLQLIAVASGEVSPSAGSSGKDTKNGATTPTVKVLWIPAVVTLVLLPMAYWLGRRSEIVSLRKKMAHERDAYEQK